MLPLILQDHQCAEQQILRDIPPPLPGIQQATAEQALRKGIRREIKYLIAGQQRVGCAQFEPPEVPCSARTSVGEAFMRLHQQHLSLTYPERTPVILNGSLPFRGEDNVHLSRGDRLAWRLICSVPPDLVNRIQTVWRTRSATFTHTEVK